VCNHRDYLHKSNNLLHGHCHPHIAHFIIDSPILRATQSGQLKSSSVNFLLLHFGAHDPRETGQRTVSSYCLDLSPRLSQYFRFLLYHSPPISSRPSSSTFSLGAPTENSLLYSKGILPQ